MNINLAKKYTIFLLQSLWKRSDKPEVITAVVSNKVSEFQPPIIQAIPQLKQDTKKISWCNLHIIRGQAKIGWVERETY
jgi:hypothetical protein